VLAVDEPGSLSALVSASVPPASTSPPVPNIEIEDSVASASRDDTCSCCSAARADGNERMA